MKKNNKTTFVILCVYLMKVDIMTDVVDERSVVAIDAAEIALDEGPGAFRVPRSFLVVVVQKRHNHKPAAKHKNRKPKQTITRRK